jgi:hypothetical protein
MNLIENALWVLGDSFCTECDIPSTRWPKLVVDYLEVKYNCGNNSLRYYNYAGGSMDTQTIIENWIKLLPYMKENDAIIANNKLIFDQVMAKQNLKKTSEELILLQKKEAEAIKLAVARAICSLNEKENNLSEVRHFLKTKGYLTQDSRIKERRKYGLKKARKASQYHKR